MANGSFRFDRFRIDPHDRRLWRDEQPVELNSRYLDALALLVGEQGRLVSKDRFMGEVWRGVPVTDEALTQCIKTLRRQLGDDAARPRFIETVPKHGYRFIAPVEAVGGESAARPAAASRSSRDWRRLILLGAAGTIGGGIAGLLGGLFYGFAAAAQPLQPGMGAASILLVIVCLTELVALIGGAGVAIGIAASQLLSNGDWRWSAFGGAVGGLVAGGMTKLLGLDAFNLLFGQSPGDITGAMEGAILGGAIGFGAYMTIGSRRAASVRKSASIAALAGGLCGILIPQLGGRLMGGSLDLLAATFPGSRLNLDQIGQLFGEAGFGAVSQAVTGGLEGALFAGCVVGAMALARRSMATGD